MSINWQMKKQTVVRPYGGILFSSKKECATDICNNVDGPQKHCEQNTSDTKGYIQMGTSTV